MKKDKKHKKSKHSKKDVTIQPDDEKPAKWKDKTHSTTDSFEEKDDATSNGRKANKDIRKDGTTTSSTDQLDDA
jgi:hypothetical protein